MVPFIIQNGVVYIDTAFIREGSIDSLKAGNAFLTDLTAIHGQLVHARIAQGNIFDLTVGRDIRSDNYLANTRGWRIRGNGSAEFDAAVIRGVLSADHIDSDVRNYVSLWQGSQTVVFAGGPYVITLDEDWNSVDLLGVSGIFTVGRFGLHGMDSSHKI